LHEGHRQRLYQKLRNGDNLFEHELLEMLLFNAYPRKNTNPIAHALLKRFSSMSAIFNAEIEELKEVEGVGEEVATYLKCVGLCTNLKNKVEGFAVIKNYSEFKEFAKLRMVGSHTEILEFYMVDKAGKVLRIYTYSVGDPNKVEVDPKKIIKAITLTNPNGMFVAHNHVTGNCLPSQKDEDFTKQIQLICSMHNVQFYDHCIFDKEGGIYSYYSEGKIDKIKRSFSIQSIIKNDENRN